MKKDKSKLKIKKWIRRGEFSVKNKQTIGDVIEQAGYMLDRVEANETVGEVLFKASDGKYYTATVEVLVSEAHPQFVKDILAEEEEEEE